MTFYAALLFALGCIFCSGLFGLVAAFVCFKERWYISALFALAAGLALVAVSGRWLWIALA